MSNNLIAPCGLNCETCDARIATVNDDNDLRSKTAAKWCQLNNTDAIKPEHINCSGCMSEGIKTVFCTSMCQVRKCCLAKGFTSCAQCDDKRNCKYIDVLISNNKDAYERVIDGKCN